MRVGCTCCRPPTRSDRYRRHRPAACTRPLRHRSRRPGPIPTARRRPSSTTCWPPTCGAASGCSCSTCWPASIPTTDRSSTSAAAPGSASRTCSPPSRASRSGRSSRPSRCGSRLHARLADSDELRRATTVVPSRFGEAELPRRASALFVSAALGHLSDAERTRLWTYVAESMPAGAPAVIGVLPPDRPLDVPLVKYHERARRRARLRGLAVGNADRRSLDGVDADLQGRRRDSRRVVAEYTATAPWRCDGGRRPARPRSPSSVSTLTEHDDCVVVRRPGPTEG